jgi:hypothetical protein
MPVQDARHRHVVTWPVLIGKEITAALARFCVCAVVIAAKSKVLDVWDHMCRARAEVAIHTYININICICICICVYIYTHTYKEIKLRNEGRKEGRTKGRQEGRQEGRKEVKNGRDDGWKEKWTDDGEGRMVVKEGQKK